MAVGDRRRNKIPDSYAGVLAKHEVEKGSKDGEENFFLENKEQYEGPSEVKQVVHPAYCKGDPAAGEIRILAQVERREGLGGPVESSPRQRQRLLINA